MLDNFLPPFILCIEVLSCEKPPENVPQFAKTLVLKVISHWAVLLKPVGDSNLRENVLIFQYILTDPQVCEPCGLVLSGQIKKKIAAYFNDHGY